MQKSDSAMHIETIKFVQSYCSSAPLCDCEFIPLQSASGVKKPKSENNPIPVCVFLSMYTILVAVPSMYNYIFIIIYAASLK